MKKYILIIILLLFAFTGLNAQSKTFCWNHVSTAGDTMAWDSTDVSLFYQIHPYVNSTGASYVTAAPAKASRFWTGTNNGTRRDSLAVIATTQLDSLCRTFDIANGTDFTWGGWMRFITTDGTNTDTSTAVRIGNLAGEVTVFYYIDDDSAKVNLWLLVDGK